MERERVAVDALVKSGAFVLYDYQLEDSSAIPPGSYRLPGLLGENFFSKVESVGFESPGTAISDAAMANIKSFTQLPMLVLEDTNVTALD